MPRIKQYQDEWVKGRLTKGGHRECAGRYETIRDHLKTLDLPDGLRVLDLGADRGYFSFRLAEDFGAQCVAVEAKPEHLERLLAANASPNVQLVGRRIESPDVLRELGAFDICIAMSVLHHVEDYVGFLDSLQDMARFVVLAEVPSPTERIDRSKTPRIPGLYRETQKRGVPIGEAEGISPSRSRRRTTFALPGRAA